VKAIIILGKVAYLELYRPSGIDPHFVGKAKAFHLNTADAEPLQDWISDQGNVNDLTRASARSAHRQAAHQQPKSSTTRNCASTYHGHRGS